MVSCLWQMCIKSETKPHSTYNVLNAKFNKATLTLSHNRMRNRQLALEIKLDL